MMFAFETPTVCAFILGFVTLLMLGGGVAVIAAAARGAPEMLLCLIVGLPLTIAWIALFRAAFGVHQ